MKAWLDTAKADASARCSDRLQGPVSEGELKDLVSWAKENGINQIVTIRPATSPPSKHCKTYVFSGREIRPTFIFNGDTRTID